MSDIPDADEAIDLQIDALRYFLRDMPIGPARNRLRKDIQSLRSRRRKTPEQRAADRAMAANKHKWFIDEVAR